MHLFGEIIVHGGKGSEEYDRFLAPYLKKTDHDAYDFPLFHQIKQVFSHGKPMGDLLKRDLDPTRAVTFAMTHDLPLNEGFRDSILEESDEELAYAFILGKDGGSPLIYSDQGEGVDPQGKKRWKEVFRDSKIKAMIHFHNLMEGIPMTLVSHGDCFLLFRRGVQGIVGINKCDTPQEIEIDLSKHPLRFQYKDVLHAEGDVLFLKEKKSLILPPRSAKMWVIHRDLKQ